MMMKKPATIGDAPEKLLGAGRGGDKETAREGEAKLREMWGEDRATAVSRLGRMFWSLGSQGHGGTPAGLHPWAPSVFLEWLCTHPRPRLAKSSFWSALFVLSIWRDIDWGDEADRLFKERKCPFCNGLGRAVSAPREGLQQGKVRVGKVPGQFVLGVYETYSGWYRWEQPLQKNDVHLYDEVVETIPCLMCEGKGHPSVRPGRFDLVQAWRRWGPEDKKVAKTWLDHPFFQPRDGEYREFLYLPGESLPWSTY